MFGIDASVVGLGAWNRIHGVQMCQQLVAYLAWPIWGFGWVAFHRSHTPDMTGGTAILHHLTYIWVVESGDRCETRPHRQDDDPGGPGCPHAGPMRRVEAFGAQVHIIKRWRSKYND